MKKKIISLFIICFFCSSSLGAESVDPCNGSASLDLGTITDHRGDGDVVVVSGAGTVAANGEYSYQYDYNGKPYYKSAASSYEIFWEDSKWLITTSAYATCYYSTEDTPEPWECNNWVVIAPGVPPVPTVREAGTLPIVLSTFAADFINNTPTLYWETQSELDNMGWNIYRNEEEVFSTAINLTEEMIPGNGTITEPSYYNYIDNSLLKINTTYYYWLESIDYSGISQVYNLVAQITIPDPSVNTPNINPPIVYDFKNVPNPVSGNTNFQFTLDSVSLVSVDIYNILGELVYKTPSVLTQEDITSSVYWNGKDEQGKELVNGVYFYNLIVNGKTEETKKLILMK